MSAGGPRGPPGGATVVAMRPRLLLALGVVVVFACGGQTLGTGTGTDGGASGHDGAASASDAPAGSDAPSIPDEDSSTFDGSSPPGILCTQGPGSGSGGQGSCEISVTETCTDGTTYQADCQCPAGTCTCSQMSAMSGSGGGGNPFVGCPVCPSPTAAFAACGFPQ